MKAAFFAANQQPVKEVSDKLPGSSLTMEKQGAKATFISVAKAFAEQNGLSLTDEGRLEYSSRFPNIQSFGIKGHVQRLFVWA